MPTRVHALCWIHMERGIRRLPGNTASSPTGNRGGAGGLVGLLPPTQGLSRSAFARQNNSDCECALMKSLGSVTRIILVSTWPCSSFAPIKRSCSEDSIPLKCHCTPMQPRPIFASMSPGAFLSGGTRHPDGRRARDTFTGLKKTCRFSRLFVLAVLAIALGGRRPYSLSS